MSAFEFVITLVALAMVYKLILVALQRRHGGSVKSSAQDEFEIVRDIQAGLARMDQRIEALETLLADQLTERKTVQK